jgi:hypothetical protein
VVSTEVSSAKVAMKVLGDVGRCLPYRIGIIVGLVHYLEVLQHVLISVQSNRSQPLHGSVGYGGRVLRVGNSLGGEPALTCIVVLRATPYRRLGKYRRMQQSSIAWNQECVDALD